MADIRWHEMTASEIQSRYDEVVAQRDRLYTLINRIDRIIHKTEPVNPWLHDRVVRQQSKEWPTLWAAIRNACTEYMEKPDAEK